MRALLIVCLVFPLGCFADQWNHHFDVPGSPEVHVSSGNLPIEVRSGTAGGVDVVLETHDVKIGPADAHVESHQDGSRLELKLVGPSDHSWWHNGWVKCVVTVPEHSAVSVHTENGPIEVHGIDGSTHVTSQNGPIHVSGLKGVLEVHTDNAPVSVQGRFTGLELRMQNGPLTLQAEPGSHLESSWHIEAENGPININLPRDLQADVSLHTGYGPHSINIPMETEGDGHDQRAKLNGGGPELMIRLQNGPVHIGQD